MGRRGSLIGVVMLKALLVAELRFGDRAVSV